MAKELNKKKEVFLDQSLDQIMSDRFGRYSKYVIQGRALPDVRDGLKPVQRRIIFAMNELGLFSDKAFKKSARIVGEVIGKYHPHGDSSIYEAMVRMGQDWKMNVPLIEMHGNKGSIDDDPAAAMRYTETRLAKITKTLLTGIKKETVAFAPNFDDSEVEPTVLPALLPNLLVNGAKGIASGYATEMPPHNLGEVIDAIITKIKSPNARLETLLQHIKGPDFPTGGEIQGIDGIYSAMERGQGKIVIRSKFKINDSKTKPTIEITEIPFGVVKSKLVRDIDEKRFNRTVSGIKDVRDETDRNGISIVIDLVPGTAPEPIVNYLLQKTDMQIYYNYNNVGIVNNAPKLLGLIELIDAYLAHQKDVQTKSLNFDIFKFEKRLEIVQGLIKVATIAEKVIDTIRKAEGSKAGVVKALMDKYNFTENQASAIADLKLYRLSKTDQSIYLDEEKVLLERIKNINSLLSDEKAFDKYLIDQLRQFKKDFATERRTTITDMVEKLEVNMEELIMHEDIWVGVTRKGYIKRVSNRAYESNTIDKYTLNENDTIIFLKKINTSHRLLAFTNKGRYIIVPSHLINETKWKDAGKHINDFAVIEPNEFIIKVFAIESFDIPVNIVTLSSNGKIKRTKLENFDASRISKPLVAMKLEDKATLTGVGISNGFNQLIIATDTAKAVKYSETQVPYQGPKSKGVKGISLPKYVKAINLTVTNKNDVIGFISKRGGAKRIKVSEILPSSRTTQGKKIFRYVKGNPHIIIDSSVVSPDTKYGFVSPKKEIIIKEFKEINITSFEEGFTLLKGKVVDGCIANFIDLTKNSKIISNIEQETEEQIFHNAEKAIDKITQLSIDDILKDI